MARIQSSRHVLNATLPLIAAAALSLGGCASKTTRVELHSSPLGAEVRTPKGEVLGLTPLVLEGETLKHAAPDGKLLSFSIDAQGYVTSQHTIEIRGQDKHEIRLRPVDDLAFREGVLFQYGVQVNHMVRDLMSIQGMIIAKRLDDADRALQAFHDKFPNVAASYVMAANLAIVRGELETAHGYLLKARSIDPNDAVVHQMLAGLASYGSRKYEAVSEDERDAVEEDAEGEREPAEEGDGAEVEGAEDDGAAQAAPAGAPGTAVAAPAAPQTDGAQPPAGGEEF